MAAAAAAAAVHESIDQILSIVKTTICFTFLFFFGAFPACSFLAGKRQNSSGWILGVNTRFLAGTGTRAGTCTDTCTDTCGCRSSSKRDDDRIIWRNGASPHSDRHDGGERGRFGSRLARSGCERVVWLYFRGVRRRQIIPKVGVVLFGGSRVCWCYLLGDDMV